MAAGTLTLGGIQYEILAVDNTKDGTESAVKGIDSVGVHYTDALTNIAFQFNMITQAAQMVYGMMKQGWDETIGRAEAYQDQMDDMHNMFGLSIEDAQKWRAATIATDTDMGAFSVTMRYVTQRVTDQSDAGEKYRATLKGIGVDVKDANGKWKDSSTLMQEILVALNGIPAGTQRAGVGADILGRNWYRVADMIDNADTAVKTFEDTHATMTEAESERTEKFKIKWAQLDDKINLAKVDVGLFFIEMDEKANDFDAKHPGIMSSQWWKDTFEKTGEGKTGAGGRKGTALPSAGEGPSLAGTFTDEYAGLSDIQIQLKETTESYEGYLAAMKTATTQEQFNKDSLAAAKLRVQLYELYDTITGVKEKEEAVSKAYKEQETIVKKLADEKKKMYELDEDYYQNVQMAGADVSEIRRLTMAHDQAKRKSTTNIAEMNTELKAVAVSITIGTVTGSNVKDVVANSVAGAAAGSNTLRQSKGIPTAVS